MSVHTLYSDNPEPQRKYLVENPAELCEQLGMELDTPAEWNAVLQYILKYDTCRLNMVAEDDAALNCDADMDNAKGKKCRLNLILIGNKKILRSYAWNAGDILRLGIQYVQQTRYADASYVNILDRDGDIVVEDDSGEVARIRAVSEEVIKGINELVNDDEAHDESCRATFENAEQLGKLFQEIYGYSY